MCGEAISCNWSFAFVGQPFQKQEVKLEQDFRKSFILLLTTSVTQKYLALPIALGLWIVEEAENTLFSDFIEVTMVCKFPLVTDSPALPSQGFSVCLGSLSVDQADLNLRYLPSSVSQVLGLKECANMPRSSLLNFMP